MPQPTRDGPIRQVHVYEDGHISVRLRGIGTNDPTVEEWHAYSVHVHADEGPLFNIAANDHRAAALFHAFERPRRERPTPREVEEFLVRCMREHPTRGAPTTQQWNEAYDREFEARYGRKPSETIGDLSGI